MGTAGGNAAGGRLGSLALSSPADIGGSLTPMTGVPEPVTGALEPMTGGVPPAPPGAPVAPGTGDPSAPVAPVRPIGPGAATPGGRPTVPSTGSGHPRSVAHEPSFSPD